MFLHPPHTATRLSGRQIRRVAAVALSVGALLFAAACGGSSAPSQGASASADPFTQQGPIEYWAGKDVTGNLPKVIEEFNKQHPQGQVTLHELPDAADQQRQQMVQNTQIKNDKMAVLSVDNVWTAEFAANQWIIPLPEDKFPTSEFLKSPVNSATYFDKMYAYPYQTDGGLLYYRKDLLDKYNLKPPTTWGEMTAACKTIQAGENDSKLSCYAGQFQKYEGLTCNFAEAIDSAGGQITDENGKPNVNTPEALKGLSFLTDSFKDGTIPKAAITWQEEQSRTAFQNGELIFLRNWAYVYRLAQKTDGSSKVAGKFAVAPLPGLDGPGVSTLGGHNLAIGTYAANKGTAADFIKYMSSEEVAKADTLATGQAHVNRALYSDPDILKKFPHFPILLKSIETANPRPKVVKYGDATLAMQDAAYGALQGEVTPEAALSGLQTKLESLTQ
jgi:multiple sugar transport system substrate-binding protein